jgi:hypothetical protein
MKTITFKEILEQLGIQSSDEFYDMMKEHWGYGADAILTFNPKTGKAEVGTIYSNDWYNVDCGKVLLLRLYLPDKEKFDRMWEELYYSAEKALERAQENQ